MAEGIIEFGLLRCHSAALELCCQIKSISGLIQDCAKGVELANGLGVLSFGAGLKHLCLQICSSISGTKKKAELLLVIPEPCHCPDKSLPSLKITQWNFFNCHRIKCSSLNYSALVLL